MDNDRNPSTPNHPTDLSDAQWQVIQKLIPPPKQGGRRRRVDLRQVVNAIRYLEATECGWRNLPEAFPNRSTVWHYHSLWKQHRVWPQICRILDGAGAPEPSDSPEADRG